MDGSYEAAKSGIFTSSNLPRLSCKLKVSMVKQMSESTNREAGEKLDFKPQRFTEATKELRAERTQDFLNIFFLSLFLCNDSPSLATHACLRGWSSRGWSLPQGLQPALRQGGPPDSGGGPSWLPLCRTVRLDWAPTGKSAQRGWTRPRPKVPMAKPRTSNHSAPCWSLPTLKDNISV